MTNTPPTAAPVAEAVTGDPNADLERARRARTEYGKYRAAAPIRIGGALAFRKGDPVPISHVERGVVGLGLVEEVPEEQSLVRVLEPSDDEPVDRIASFLDRGADEVIADVDQLDDAERSAAVLAEEAGKNRVTVLRALGRQEGTTTEPADQEV